MRRICFEANLSKYGSYSLHIHMFWYIRKHHFVTSFAVYSLQNIYRDSHTNIQFDEKIHVTGNICFRVNIRLRFSHSGDFASKYSFTSEYSQASFTFNRTFFCKYSHTSEYSLCKYLLTSEYSLCIASNCLGKPFTSLRYQLILVLFENIRLERNICFSLNSFPM